MSNPGISPRTRRSSKPPYGILILLVWVAVILISIYQYQTLKDSMQFTSFWDTILKLLLVCTASTWGVFVLRLIFLIVYGAQITKSGRLVNHFGVSVNLCPIIVYIVCIVDAFGQTGFFTGLFAIMLFGIIAAINFGLSLLLLGLGAKDIKSLLTSGNGSDQNMRKPWEITDASEKTNEYQTSNHEKSLYGTPISSGTVYQGFGLKANMIGGVTPSGIIYVGSGRNTTPIGEVEYSTVYRGTKKDGISIGEVDQNIVYRGIGRNRTQIGEIKGNMIIMGSGLSATPIGEVSIEDFGEMEMVQKAGAALLLLLLDL